MTTRRDVGRIAAGAIALLAVLTLAGLGALASRAARPKPEPCPDGRYLVDGSPLLSGAATTPADGVRSRAVLADLRKRGNLDATSITPWAAAPSAPASS
jgi:hypothetical protein